MTLEVLRIGNGNEFVADEQQSQGPETATVGAGMRQISLEDGSSIEGFFKPVREDGMSPRDVVREAALSARARKAMPGVLVPNDKVVIENGRVIGLFSPCLPNYNFSHRDADGASIYSIDIASSLPRTLISLYFVSGLLGTNVASNDFDFVGNASLAYASPPELLGLQEIDERALQGAFVSSARLTKDENGMPRVALLQKTGNDVKAALLGTSKKSTPSDVAKCISDVEKARQTYFQYQPAKIDPGCALPEDGRRKFPDLPISPKSLVGILSLNDGNWVQGNEDDPYFTEMYRHLNAMATAAATDADVRNTLSLIFERIYDGLYAAAYDETSLEHMLGAEDELSQFTSAMQNYDAVIRNRQQQLRKALAELNANPEAYFTPENFAPQQEGKILAALIRNFDYAAEGKDCYVQVDDMPEQAVLDIAREAFRTVAVRVEAKARIKQAAESVISDPLSDKEEPVTPRDEESDCDTPGVVRRASSAAFSEATTAPGGGFSPYQQWVDGSGQGTPRTPNGSDGFEKPKGIDGQGAWYRDRAGMPIGGATADSELQDDDEEEELGMSPPKLIWSRT